MHLDLEATMTTFMYTESSQKVGLVPYNIVKGAIKADYCWLFDVATNFFC